MRQRLTYLVLLLPLAWTGVSASLDLDFEVNADTYYPDDTLFTSTDTSEWSNRVGDWSSDPDLNLELSPDLNPDLLVNADSNNECHADADQLQMPTSRRLRGRDLCPNPLLQTPPSSHDALDRKFLESLPILSLYTYKEPDPNICPKELFGRFIYPICGSGEDRLLADDTIIYPCNPYVPHVGCMDPMEDIWCCKWVDWLPGVPVIQADVWTPEICRGYACIRPLAQFHHKF